MMKQRRMLRYFRIIVILRIYKTDIKMMKSDLIKIEAKSLTPVKYFS